VICDHILFPSKTRYISHHQIRDIEDGAHDFKGLYYTVIELPKFTKTQIHQLETMVEKWCHFFKYAQEVSPEELKKLEKLDPIMKKAYDAVNSFNWSEEELETYYQEQKILLDAANVRETYFVEGKVEGKIEGRVKEKAAVISRSLKKGWSLEDIAEITELTIEQVKEIIANQAKKDCYPINDRMENG
jgi:predicted transposase/invertase (TIGR01784 family)